MIGISHSATVHSQSRLRAILDIDNIVAKQGCFSCSPDSPLQTRCSTPDAQITYDTTGCCEACASRHVPSLFKESSALTSLGKQLGALWMSVFQHAHVAVDQPQAALLCDYIWQDVSISRGDIFVDSANVLTTWQ